MSNQEDYVLAIDNGTQSVRALVFDLNGQIVAKSKIEIEPYFSAQPGWAEQHVEYFWDNLCKVCDLLWRTWDGPKSAIKSVAVTTQRATMVNLDAEGQPTTDPEAGLKGSMVPSGGYKGVGIALTVELMAAAMTGATLGAVASPFSGTAGGPPKTGQFFIAIDPQATAGGLFQEKLSELIASFRDQDGARLPGDGRHQARIRAASDGVAVNAALLEKVRALL